MEPSIILGKEAGLSSMERFLAMHTVNKAGEDRTDMFVNRYFYDTGSHSQTRLKIVVRSSPDTCSEIKHVLAHSGIYTKINVEEVIKMCLTEWTSTLRSHILKAVGSIFEIALQVDYFNFNNVPRISMLKMI